MSPLTWAASEQAEFKKKTKHNIRRSKVPMSKQVSLISATKQSELAQQFGKKQTFGKEQKRESKMIFYSLLTNIAEGKFRWLRGILK